MTTGSKGRQLIEHFEGLRLSAYQDQGGVWTIGYGHTRGVHEGDTCTQIQADAWLEGDLADAERAVNHLVTADLTQNQFDALVSFTYNVGSGNLQHSKLLELLNTGDKPGAADQFLVWNHVAGKVNPGLTNRRTSERALFLEP